MASAQEIPSFDDIIQAGRQRKKAESLAAEIFGKSRRTSSPLTGARTKSSGVSSLASRISKPGQRAASSSSATKTKIQAALSRDPALANGGRPPRKNPFNGGSADNLGYAQNGHLAPIEFSIKGAAGPYVVVGSNFAPGTTGADIQSAMEAITGEMLSCQIVTSYPTVIAEMVFGDKAIAETVVATFNNQKADGRLLHVYHKNGPPTKLPSPAPSPAPLTHPSEDRAPTRELIPEKHSTMDYHSSRSTDNRHATPDIQDGNYGFSSKEDDMELDVEDSTPQRAPAPRSEASLEPAPPRSNDPPPPRSDLRNEPRNDRANDRYDDRRDNRYGYRQGYSRDTRSDRDRPPLRGYDGRDSRYRNGMGNGGRRPPEPNRLYSDDIYGSSYSRSGGRGYR